MSDSVRPHRRQPTRLPRPWDSPGKNTGVGCHFLLQCMKVKRESEVAQSCLTLSDPMDCSLTGSSVHGIFQARVLEWGAIAFSVRMSSVIYKHTGVSRDMASWTEEGVEQFACAPASATRERWLALHRVTTKHWVFHRRFTGSQRVGHD